MRDASAALFSRAARVTPGGVNSPVRAFRAVGGEPFFAARGEGARIYDADGNAYVDFVMSWGALMLGHAHGSIVQSVQAAAARGTSFGTPSPLEVELAEAVVDAVPGVEMVRFVNSGTEATMSALRLARAATGRALVLKFTGCYHGHADAFLVHAGSGVATLGLPDSPGVPPEVARLTLVAPFNDLEAVRSIFASRGGDIACVIVEPVVGNGGYIPPARDFLAGLRQICSGAGALLLFDEVMTGFRVAFGGAQARFQVTPDLTTLGKVIGGGLPVGAYGGARSLMERIAPQGDVYQAGTLSGNPLAMAAGLTQLRELRALQPYAILERRAMQVIDAVGSEAARLGIPFHGGACGAMWGMHFREGPVLSFEDAKQADKELFARFFRAALGRGVFLPPSPFEACFLSSAHDEAVIAYACEQLQESLKEAVR